MGCRTLHPGPGPGMACRVCTAAEAGCTCDVDVGGRRAWRWRSKSRIQSTAGSPAGGMPVGWKSLHGRRRAASSQRHPPAAHTSTCGSGRQAVRRARAARAAARGRRRRRAGVGPDLVRERVAGELLRGHEERRAADGRRLVGASRRHEPRTPKVRDLDLHPKRQCTAQAQAWAGLAGRSPTPGKGRARALGSAAAPSVRACLHVPGEQDVGRAQVTVHHSGVVHVLHALRARGALRISNTNATPGGLRKWNRDSQPGAGAVRALSLSAGMCKAEPQAYSAQILWRTSLLRRIRFRTCRSPRATCSTSGSSSGLCCIVSARLIAHSSMTIPR